MRRWFKFANQHSTAVPGPLRGWGEGEQKRHGTVTSAFSLSSSWAFPGFCPSFK